MFSITVSSSTLRVGLYLFYTEKFITQFKTTEKMIGHHTSLRENADLPLWRGSAIKKLNLPPKSFFGRSFCLLCLAAAQKIAHAAHLLSWLA